MNISAANKAAIVTGAGSGLGAAIAFKLSELGITVVLVDRDEHGLRQTAAKLKTGYLLLTADVCDEKQVAAAVDQAGSHFGGISILVNCAGITGITNIRSHEVDLENVRKVFDVNFFGSMIMSKYVLPWMLRENYGRILHIASISGKEGNAGMLAYSSSKAAVIAMTKVQAKEYADTGITINALAPAVIRTALVDAMPPEQVKYMTDKIAMKRCGTLDEFADMAAFIVSPQCSFTTGFTFDLSGGRATY